MPSSVDCSVPQGSVLGPLEFISYTEDVAVIFQRSQVNYHMFADDKQLYDCVPIGDIDAARQRLSACIKDIKDWCASRRLQLNAMKTELIWFGSRTSLRKMALNDLSLTVGDDVIKPVTSVRDLGVYMDAELKMKEHVSHVTRSCFFILRRS